MVIGVGAYYMRSFRSGRELYAIGSQPRRRAARRHPASGGACSPRSSSAAGWPALAGVLWASKYGTLDSTAGTGYELQVIAAVVIGGVAIFGGSGSVVGAALGALLLSTILAALYVVGVSPFWTQAIDGVLILVAIAIDRLISVQLTASLRKRRRAVKRPELRERLAGRACAGRPGSSSPSSRSSCSAARPRRSS